MGQSRTFTLQWRKNEIDVNGDYYKAEKGDYNRPSYPPEFIISSIMFKGIDIYPILSDDDVCELNDIINDKIQ